ncbi:unnamed protein product [Coregonus sp. 'balchen']|nr:unnamed protein product [Coregonus sp. 'balchen']
MTAKDLLQIDLYGLLGIKGTATAKEIKKAYRQKALTCHPDKNPDNPKAADLFHQLSQALEVLTDAAARAAYDKICAAKKQAEERNNKLDAKRRKIKLDLEARERQAEAHSAEQFQNTRTLEEELKWKCKKEDDTNGGYSQDFILSLLSKYGNVLNVLISSKKRGSAVVEFETVKAAELAYKNESGVTANPLKISWLEGQPEVITPVVSQVCNQGQPSPRAGQPLPNLNVLRPNSPPLPSTIIVVPSPAVRLPTFLLTSWSAFITYWHFGGLFQSEKCCSTVGKCRWRMKPPAVVLAVALSQLPWQVGEWAQDWG